jgi:hypothetical protein
MTVQLSDASVLDDFQDPAWRKYVSPIHPRYFVKLAAVLLFGAFILFSTLLV